MNKENTGVQCPSIVGHDTTCIYKSLTQIFFLKKRNPTLSCHIAMCTCMHMFAGFLQMHICIYIYLAYVKGTAIPWFLKEHM